MHYSKLLPRSLLCDDNMTITPFKITDLGAFIPNEYSDPDQVIHILLCEQYEVQTLWGDDGLVQAIICFSNYWGDCWSCFMLVSQNFDPSLAPDVRELITRYMNTKAATRLQTESRAEPILRKWHRFLGFHYEGTKRKMMFNQDYDCWAIVREGV